MGGIDGRQPLNDTASEVGLMPRLRSLRVTEYQESNAMETRPSPRRLTSIPGSPPGERSPLQHRQGSNGTEFHRRLSKELPTFRETKARSPWVNVILVGTVMLVVVAAAFYAGSAFTRMKMGAHTRLIEGVGKGTIFSSSIKDLVSGAFSSAAVAPVDDLPLLSYVAPASHSTGNRTKTDMGDADDFFKVLSKTGDVTAATSGDEVIQMVTGPDEHEGQDSKTVVTPVKAQGGGGFAGAAGGKPKTGGDQAVSNITVKTSKAVVYASVTDSLAALDPNITHQHLKVFVADLGPKYNLDIMEAYNNLGVESALPEEIERRRTTQDLIENPYGPAVGADKQAGEVRATAPNNLDLLFHSLLLKSPLRVTTASEADVVLVPFWVHKLIKLDQELEKPNKYDLAPTNFWKNLDTMLPLLGKKPHLLIIPGQEAELRSTCGGFGLDFLCHPRSADFLIVTPEVFTSRPGSLLSAKVAPGILGNLVREGAPSLPVPDNTNVHFHENSKLWMEQFDAKACNASKTKLVSEAFRPRAPLRKALKTQCLERPKECTHVEPSLQHREGSAEYWEQVRGNDAAAWFSLQPPGDTAIQAEFYEALIAGAIPTIFDPKLPKILPFTDAVKWEVVLASLNAEDVTKQKKQIADLLKAENTVEDRLSKLASIHTIRHLFQYSLNPNEYLVRFDHANLVTEQDDAFTMSLKAAMRTLCSLGQLPTSRCSPKKLARLF